MSRVSNVDNVAPDDPIVDSSAILPKAAKPTKSQTTNAPLTESVYKILGHTKHPLSSMLIKPHVFDFQERDDDEEILVVARRHWFTNVRWVCITVFMVWVPSLFRFVPTVIDVPVNYLFVSYLFWYIMTFAYAFEQFLSWYFNVYIITNKRVIDIDFSNLLTKKYTEAGIDVIQDVTSSVIGAIPTIFNYGNILIQTASEINELIFERVANPEKIIKVLQELRDHHGGKN